MGAAKSKSKPRAKHKSEHDLLTTLTHLKRLAKKSVREGMKRFAIPDEHAFGVSMADLRTLGKQIGRDHRLAGELWETGVYEARLLAALVDEPSAVTSAQMDQWRKDFDNWAVCDTVCFHLFDRAPPRWKKIGPWSRPGPQSARAGSQFARRAAFALLWGLTVHDKAAPDDQFLAGLKLIEQAATDERNFVKKAVNMALRATGKRNAKLHAAALAVAERLAASTDATARWNGKDALRELRKTRPRA